MAMVKPQATKKKLETEYKRILNKFEKVCNRIQAQIQANPNVVQDDDDDLLHYHHDVDSKDPHSSSLVDESKSIHKFDDDDLHLLQTIDPKLKLVTKEQAEILASQEEARHIDEIEQEADEVAEILSTINTTVQDQNKELEKVQDNVVEAGHSVERGKGDLKKAAAMAAVGSALIGATIGAVVLGPVGAAVGASVATSLSIGTGIGVSVGAVAGGSIGATVSYLVGKKAAKKAAETPPEEKKK